MQQGQHRARAPQILRQRAAWCGVLAVLRIQGCCEHNGKPSTRRGDVQISARVSDRCHKTCRVKACTMGNDHSRAHRWTVEPFCVRVWRPVRLLVPVPHW
ncbi:hypothetical protein CVO74_06815 [Xanthomonas prunicola]|uniref:Uncharacterized protein n=1 Tax=Xanthomonas prunicola TaxID=2053930 RepID=A0A2N3RHG8_9XANT|nr:hypothetical protein XpruCFBP8353_13855 [Xanthomonas prunicola]PKV16233.1 hypothetical protein XpruCFBP8354_13840 [Xanthomonas prunicola]PKV22899.1 hypothetical protein CVO74_06815 [Xanthomonas prunicola]